MSQGQCLSVLVLFSRVRWPLHVYLRSFKNVADITCIVLCLILSVYNLTVAS